MKKLFQNKKILLFTLILMVSCLGILGAGEKSEAASCFDLYCVTGGKCYEGDVACEDNKPSIVTNKPTYAVYGCFRGTAKKYKITCNAADFTCISSTLSNECYDFCCRLAKGENCKCNEKDKCVFTGACEEECVDISKCTGGAIVVRSSDGPTDCYSGSTCVKRGSCVPKTTAVCDCRYGNWQDSGKCGSDGGCLSDDQMFQTRIKNPTTACGPNDCKDTTRCKKDNIKCPSKTIPPAATVPVIPQSTSTGSGVPTGGATQKPPSSGGAVGFTNPLSTDSFEALVMGIINWILGIVVSLAILFLIIGGLMYIISAGDEEKIKKAKNIIMYAIIGLGVVILSWSIITELKDILGVVPQ